MKRMLKNIIYSCNILALLICILGISFGKTEVDLLKGLLIVIGILIIDINCLVILNHFMNRKIHYKDDSNIGSGN